MPDTRESRQSFYLDLIRECLVERQNYMFLARRRKQNKADPSGPVKLARYMNRQVRHWEKRLKDFENNS